ncbi:hypothetical protein AB205_0190630 [Aquarana catesbeiana]|uniref:Uncharacterized protein n=1 Tax=Aquarana catesbeiana TaxID=8400 RepID=A0A2G9Q7Y1_AQUCT|nr:hypothetical protein AB205_0190630 [Aquarana catesbeiana]
MQESFGLKVTGTLDLDTMEMMQQPRCGFVDVGEYSVFPGNSGWKTRVLTYSYPESLSGLDKCDPLVTPLTFTRIYNSVADIEISFAAQGMFIRQCHAISD